MAAIEEICKRKVNIYYFDNIKELKLTENIYIYIYKYINLLGYLSLFWCISICYPLSVLSLLPYKKQDKRISSLALKFMQQQSTLAWVKPFPYWLNLN